MSKKKLVFLLILGLLFQFSFCQKSEVAITKQIISKQKIKFLQPPKRIPTNVSVDAPLLGNGFTGVAISGMPEKQVYHIARNDFWRLEHGYQKSFPAVLGKLEISIPELEGSSYLIEQDLYDAKTRSRFTKTGAEVRFKTYVAATEDIMVIEITLQGEELLKGYINLKLPEKEDFTDGFPNMAESKKGKTEQGVAYISRAFLKDVDIPTKAAVSSVILGSASNNFILKEGSPIRIAVAFSSNFKSDDCLKTVIERLTNLKKDELINIEENHNLWWGNYWSKSYVNIHDDIIEKQYYLSNYGLGSFSRDKDFPPSIFGTTVTKELPAWNGDYHLNYNHFAPFYGLFSSNHIEQAIPSNTPLLAIQERGEYYSEKITNIKGGIMLPVGIGPLGIESTRRNKLMDEIRGSWVKDGVVEDEGLFWHQKSNSAYSVVNMSMHFYSTYDKEYTEQYYPFVKGVATFWENYLTWENGRYVIYNDAIHEGSGDNVNPILSLGLVRLVMQTAIDMSYDLNKDKERIEKWQHVLDYLSDYTYQEREGKKVFRYTEKGTDWWGGNTLGIQHIYPVGQIGLNSDSELLKVAHNTIDIMQRWIDGNGSNSFFPAAVRVGYDADTILSKMRKYVANTYSNGYQYDNPHGIENFSTVPNTINEMLCMGHGGVLRVFPVWPKNNDASFHSLRTQGAFLVSSELKNGEVQYVKITSEKGKTCTFKNPWPAIAVNIESNQSKTKELKGEFLRITTKPGEEFVLKPIQR